MPTAIVTGASKGLGRAVAVELARRGWSLVVDARDDGRLRSTEKELIEKGARALAVRGDIADAAHRRELVDAARQLGGLDCLVNNAAVLTESAERVFAVNVVAPIELIELAKTLLDAATTPRIVNISSEAAVEVRRGLKEYCASKAALDHLSAVLAAENPTWRVWAVDPGEMRTDMLQLACLGRDITDRPLPDEVAARIGELVESNQPSGRLRATR